MNCKPGDLAVIVKVDARPENQCLLGRIIRVTNIRMSNAYGDPCWAYEGAPLIDFYGATCLAIPDELLRPLRDNPGQDETLTWLDVPTKETA